MILKDLMRHASVTTTEQHYVMVSLAMIMLDVFTNCVLK